MSCLRRRSIEAKLKYLQSTPFFVYVEEDDLEVLAKCFSIHRFSAGAAVPESPFYVLIKGELSIVNKSDGQTLCTKSAGAFFSRKAGLVEVPYKPRGISMRRSQSRRSSRSSSRTKNSGGDRQSPSAVEQSASGNSDVEIPSSLAATHPASSSTFSTLDAFESIPREPTTFSSSKASLAESTTTIVAKTDGEVLLLPPGGFARFMSRAGEQSNLGVRSMMSTNIESMLLRVPFIRDAALDSPAIRALGELCSYSALDSGERVFAQGDSGDDFFMILHGAVHVHIDVKAFESESPRSAHAGALGLSSEQKEQRPGIVRAATIGAGQCFGEMALVVRSSRFASVTTAERSLFLVVSKAHFSAFLAVAPALELSVMRHAKVRLFERYANLKVPFFADVSAEQIQQAAEMSSVVHKGAGELICRQGEPGEAFYVVVDGAVRVRQVPSDDTLAGGVNSIRDPEDEEALAAAHAAAAAEGVPDLGLAKEMDVMLPGRYFGEIAVMLPGTMCTAFCSATDEGKCTLLMLPKAAFHQLFGHNRVLVAELHLKLLRQECALTHVLNHNLARPLFERKLRAEYAHEALAFHDLVAQWQAKPADEQRASAAAIVDEYIKEGAPQQVNIPDVQRKEILANYEGNCSPSLFDKAKKEAYLLMARDTYRRFVREEEFLQLLDTLGSYKGRTQLAQANLTAIHIEV